MGRTPKTSPSLKLVVGEGCFELSGCGTKISKWSKDTTILHNGSWLSKC
jgi:hypothetical protein